MKIIKKILYSILSLIMIISITACATKKEETTKLKKVDFILDWTPNTNHTGLYVAKEKGYLKEAGIDLDIKLPPEDSSSDLVINNKAPFAIYFQDSMANKLAKGAEITAVAAIIEHNTSGIISKKQANITRPKDLENKKYGTWNDPIELAMIKNIMDKEKADFKKLELVPNTDSNSVTAIENKVFDAAWIFYAWDGLLAKSMNIDTNFFYLKDFAPELDYYSPVIIANNKYLKENGDEAKKIIQAIKKGYQYAIENPKEAAEILIKYAPELKDKKEFVIESQKYLAKQYATNKDKWGEIDPARWNKFYKWLNENKITENPLKENAGFTNEYIK
ncbi:MULTISPECIES: ABC transporter substrate-binding protein [unclassified Gemella]|uniref:ABC transporter substrate-binding protein n=1 Tax=unclassified Gemella TaxID=2624949 RepID=UPI00207B6E2F|nr:MULTISPECIES: ABC transporter substrate-binding protein [unclassified Gemella]